MKRLPFLLLPALLLFSCAGNRSLEFTANQAPEEEAEIFGILFFTGAKFEYRDFYLFKALDEVPCSFCFVTTVFVENHVEGMAYINKQIQKGYVYFLIKGKGAFSDPSANLGPPTVQIDGFYHIKPLDMDGLRELKQKAL